jgi:hypothetical protein
MYTKLLFVLVWAAHILYVLTNRKSYEQWQFFGGESMATVLLFSPWLIVLLLSRDTAMEQLQWTNTPQSLRTVMRGWFFGASTVFDLVARSLRGLLFIGLTLLGLYLW